jgi:hypothetical protein
VSRSGNAGRQRRFARREVGLRLGHDGNCVLRNAECGFQIPFCIPHSEIRAPQFFLRPPSGNGSSRRAQTALAPGIAAAALSSLACMFLS